jgi:hypothetical protein
VANDVVLALVIVTGLPFGFTNGFHDAANAMTTSIAAKALSPRVAARARGRAEPHRRVPVAERRRPDRQRLAGTSRRAAGQAGPAQLAGRGHGLARR